MNDYNENLVIILVGLPARGVSTLGSKIARYFSWLGYLTTIFNREAFEISKDNEEDFTPSIELNEIDGDMIDKVAQFLNDSGKIVIIDANNYTSIQRKNTRLLLESKIKKQFKMLFLEIINNNEESVNEIINYYCSYAEYFKNVTADKAVETYKEKIRKLEAVYESMDEKCDGEDCCYIRVYRHSTKLEALNVRNGYLISKLMAFIMNVKLDKKKTIYLLRHAESYNSIEGIMGSDLGITEDGVKYSVKLKEFFIKEKELYNNKEFMFYTSSLRRTEETSAHISDIGRKISLKCLDDINVGTVDGKKYREIREDCENELNERAKDKLNFRFERGESYMDLINRLDNFIFDMERTSNIIVLIGHQSVLRCLYGYLNSINVTDIPHISIPNNVVIKIEEFVNTRIVEKMIKIETDETDEYFRVN